MFEKDFSFIKNFYPGLNPIPLHAPVFLGREKEYLNECIDSTFVSYVGPFVKKFEDKICEITGAKFAVGLVNGTCALQLALNVIGVRAGDEVLTQGLTFAATANAIIHNGSIPVFLDVEKEGLGLCPHALEFFLLNNTVFKNGELINKKSGRKISACLPVSIFGHPPRIFEIKKICENYHIPLMEDVAEALGSYLDGKHLGRFGELGVLSFNGNKIVTTGGGGAIITDDESLYLKAHHLSTTAKVRHPYEYIHDEVAFNFRIPNLNAAVGFAQLEYFDKLIQNKRKLSKAYANHFTGEIKYFTGPNFETSNIWLNTINFKDSESRIKFLEDSNKNGVLSRALWKPLTLLSHFDQFERDGQENCLFLYNHLANIPSGFSFPLK